MRHNRVTHLACSEFDNVIRDLDINHQYEHTLLTTLTLRPTKLLCRFIFARASFSCSRESTNLFANLIPYTMLALQPPHSKPFLLLPLRFSSHVHSLSSPLLHARVISCTTPAEDMAYTNALSLLAVKGQETRKH